MKPTLRQRRNLNYTVDEGQFALGGAGTVLVVIVLLLAIIVLWRMAGG